MYNLTVEGEHEYYANGVLVHNCDALSMACILAQKYKGKADEVETDEDKQVRLKKEREERFNKLLWQGLPY